MTFEDYLLMQETLNAMLWDSETQEEDIWYERDWMYEENN
jgi:hypothetical protein